MEQAKHEPAILCTSSWITDFDVLIFFPHEVLHQCYFL